MVITEFHLIQPQVTEILEKARIENLDFHPSLESALEVIAGKLLNKHLIIVTDILHMICSIEYAQWLGGGGR